ncbi:MAG: energy transducer TonB [Gammaproteobacteria bacterium]
MRHVIFALAASLVTMLLLLVMIGLIRSDPPHAPVFEPREPVTLVSVKPDRPEPRVVVEPPVPVKAPPPLDLAQAPSNWAEVDREIDFESGPFKIAGRGAMPLVAMEPVYPMKALRDGTTGWVRIQFTINPDGSVSDIFVADAVPRHGIFDSAALQALDRSRFIPKTMNGVAVPSRAEWTFTFTRAPAPRS